jgi:hypothetical protein
MSTTALIRWSGGALLLAGALITAHLFHPDGADPNAMLDPAWSPVHILLGAGFIVSLLGLIGLHARQANEAGRLGAVGFALVFVSTATVGGSILSDEGFILPAIARDDAAGTLLDPSGPIFGGPFGLVFLSASIAFALGAILLGIATIRAGVLPRWAGVLLLAGGPLVPFAPPLPQVVGNVGGLLLGLGYVWLGYAVWSESAARSAQPEETAAAN